VFANRYGEQSLGEAEAFMLEMDEFMR